MKAQNSPCPDYFISFPLLSLEVIDIYCYLFTEYYTSAFCHLSLSRSVFNDVCVGCLKSAGGWGGVFMQRKLANATKQGSPPHPLGELVVKRLPASGPPEGVEEWFGSTVPGGRTLGI